MRRLGWGLLVPGEQGISTKIDVGDILEKASKSPLGIVALVIVAFGVLGFALFRKSSEKIRIWVFGITGGAMLLFGITAMWEYRQESHLLDPKSGGNPPLISGFIFDEQTNEPITHADITFGGLAMSTHTDDVGNFSIQVPPDLAGAQTLSLHVLKSGYAPTDRTIPVPATNINVGLERRR